MFPDYGGYAAWLFSLAGERKVHHFGSVKAYNRESRKIDQLTYEQQREVYACEQ
jgi:hypothetical protein